MFQKIDNNPSFPFPKGLDMAQESGITYAASEGHQECLVVFFFTIIIFSLLPLLFLPSPFFQTTHMF